MDAISTDAATCEVGGVMQGLAEKLVRSPDELLVLAKREGNCVQVQVTAGEQDIGRLIGARGETARALRRILLAIGGKHHVTCEVNFNVFAETSGSAV